MKRLLGDQEKNLIFYISGSFVIMTDHIDIKRVQPTLIFSFFFPENWPTNGYMWELHVFLMLPSYVGFNDLFLVHLHLTALIFFFFFMYFSPHQHVESRDKGLNYDSTTFIVLQSPSCIWLFSTSWTEASRLPCPSLSHRVYSNSCPLSWWCYITISSSASFFSFCL